MRTATFLPVSIILFSATVLLLSCPLGQSGTLKVILSPTVVESESTRYASVPSGSGKTLLPSIQAQGYRLSFNGPSNIEFVVETSDTVIERNLGVGEWTIAAEALDSSSRTIAAGTATGVVVSAFGTDQVSITLFPGMSATGTIDVMLTWSAELLPPVEKVSGMLGETEIPLADITFSPSDHSARYNSIQASGSYKLDFELVWGEFSIKPRQEAVQVYDYLTTSGTIDVTSDYFKPPKPPTNLTVAPGTRALVLAWTDNSAVETGYVIQRSVDGVTWINLLTAPLPENTVAYRDASAEAGTAYTYQVQALNGIGESGYCPASTPVAWVAVDKTIDHTNYDPATLSGSAILAAAALKVYFEHASTGQDIVGDSDTDSTAGNNYSGNETCGLAELYASSNGTRYLCDRESYEEGNNVSWYTTHAGLQTNNRYNPPPAQKLSGFLSLSAAMRAAVDVAMFKFCWIDVWDGSNGDTTTGYIANGASFAASLINDIEAFETANPGLVVPYWTMPLQTNQSYPARENYNSAIRAYCASNGKWLLDIADLECHNVAGVKLTDGTGREIMYTNYAMPDGGHLSTAGRLKLAQAYWTMLAGIALELAGSGP